MENITKEQAMQEVSSALWSIPLSYSQHIHLQECLELITKNDKDV